jgi:hypothetical protein
MKFPIVVLCSILGCENGDADEGANAATCDALPNPPGEGSDSWT